jgi:hypothetical protein
MDRQRNDRLGRKDEHYLAKHRRKILRRCTESDTHADTFCNPNRDSYANSHSNGNCNAYAYTHGNSELDAQPDCHAEVSTDAAAAPHAGTSTVMDGVSLQAGFGHGNQVLKT